MPSLRAFLAIATTLLTVSGCNRSKQATIKQMSALRPRATFTVKGNPDWMALAPDSVWVTNSAANLVSQLRATDNQPGLTATTENLAALS